MGERMMWWVMVWYRYCTVRTVVLKNRDGEAATQDLWRDNIIKENKTILVNNEKIHGK